MRTQSKYVHFVNRWNYSCLLVCIYKKSLLFSVMILITSFVITQDPGGLLFSLMEMYEIVSGTSGNTWRGELHGSYLCYHNATYVGYAGGLLQIAIQTDTCKSHRPWAWDLEWSNHQFQRLSKFCYWWFQGVCIPSSMNRQVFSCAYAKAFWTVVAPRLQ